MTGTSDNVPNAIEAGNVFRVHDGRKRTAETRFPAYALRSVEWRSLVDAGHAPRQARDERGRLVGPVGGVVGAVSAEPAEVGGSPLAAHVLLLLWAHARTDKGTRVTKAWCSLRRLADLTGSYKKSIYDALARLRRDGWISEVESRRRDGRRLADCYTLTLPGTAGVAHAQMVARLSQPDGPACTSPLVVPGDIYHYNGAWHVREARIPLPVLGSWAWTQLRRSSPLAMHVYCFLVAYAPDDEHLGGTRLAREARLHKSRIPETIETLSTLRWIDVRKRFAGKQRLSDAFVILDVESAQAVSPETPASLATVPVALPAPEPPPSEAAPAEVFGEGKPPADLVAEAGEQCSGIEDWCTDREMWDMIRSLGLWPRPAPPMPMTPERQAAALVVEFHVATGAHVEEYAPTARETALAEDLIAAYRGMERDILRFVIGRLRRARFVPDDFGGIRRYLPDAAKALRLPPDAARRLAGD